MKLFLCDQEKYLQDHLESLKRTPTIQYNKQQLQEKITAIDLGPRRLEDVALDFL